ncbi:DUF5709 domain-containing protein [Streptomyces atratus]
MLDASDTLDHRGGDEPLDEGSHENAESDLIASDIGPHGADASAEEAATHVIPDSETC